MTAGPGRSADSPASTSSSRLLGKLNVGNGSFRSSPKVAPSSPQVDTVPSPVVLAGDAPSTGDGHTVTPLALDGTAGSASTMAKSVAAVDSPVPNPAMRRIAGDMRTNSDVSVSQVTAALGESSAAADGGDDDATTAGAGGAGAGLPKTGSGAGLAGLAGAFGAPKPKPKPMSSAAAKYVWVDTLLCCLPCPPRSRLTVLPLHLHPQIRRAQQEGRVEEGGGEEGV